MRYLIVLLFLLATTAASADTTITYQGQLQDGSGPVTDTPAMEFRLYDSLTGSTQIGDTVVNSAVPVTEGLFQVQLDFGEVFDGSSLFLEVTVEGQPLTPRQPITAVPMAQFAMTPAGPEGPEGASPFELNGDDAVYPDGNVGIGTSLPNATLQVVGSANFGASANEASGSESFVSGGAKTAPNVAGGAASFVGGGAINEASADASFVGGGQNSTASGFGSFIGGGQGNVASGEFSFIGGGFENIADAQDSFVAGGWDNKASGQQSFAAGRRAKAEHNSTFVWADSTNADFASTGVRQFLIRAGGGVGINTNSPANSLTIAGDADINGSIGIGTSAPERDLHIKQQSNSTSEIGLQIERGGSSTNNWAFYVAVSDNLGFRYNDDLVARINTDGEFATLSDARFKTDIEPMAGAMERIMQLEPASYRMTRGAADDEPSVGLIAQQVGQVLPGAVSEEEGTMGVYYNQITALNTAALIELNSRHLEITQRQRHAIEEQQAVIEAQQVRIADLEQRQDVEVSALQDRLAALEALLLEDRQVAGQSQ